MAFIHDLPNEILLHILKMLKKSSISVFMLVCKKWRDLGITLLDDMYISMRPNDWKQKFDSDIIYFVKNIRLLGFSLNKLHPNICNPKQVLIGIFNSPNILFNNIEYMENSFYFKIINSTRLIFYWNDYFYPDIVSFIDIFKNTNFHSNYHIKKVIVKNRSCIDKYLRNVIDQTYSVSKNKITYLYILIDNILTIVRLGQV